MNDEKYLICLHHPDGRNAVIIDENPLAARQRATTFDPIRADWNAARLEIITRVRRSRMNRILALEMRPL